MADAETATPTRSVRLQVAPARQEESGAGIARMPRSAFQKLGITEGDVVDMAELVQAGKVRAHVEGVADQAGKWAAQQFFGWQVGEWHLHSEQVAAYLQAGLLVPSEEEALTVRATRDAMAKLEANPERLLN